MKNPTTPRAQPLIVDPGVKELTTKELPKAVLQGIKANRSKLLEIGVINDLSNPALEKEINQSFFAIQNTSEDQLPESKEFRRVLQLCAFSGQSVPITLGDWYIDRVKEAAEKLGLKDFITLQKILGEKYGQPSKKSIHIDKGPGDGSLMAHLRQADTKDQWEVVGIGDTICVLIERVLEKFILPAKKDDQAILRFVELIGLALRRSLREKWYKVKGNVIREWEKQVPFFDLNLIFELLADPVSLLSKLKISPREGLYVAPEEFDEEKKRAFEDSVYELILHYEGWQSIQESKEIPARLESLLKSKQKILGKKLNDLRHKKAEFKQELYKLGPNKTAEDEDLFTMIYQEDLIPVLDNNPTSCSTVADFFQTIDQTIARWEEQFKSIRLLTQKIMSLRKKLDVTAHHVHKIELGQAIAADVKEAEGKDYYEDMKKAAEEDLIMDERHIKNLQVAKVIYQSDEKDLKSELNHLVPAGAKTDKHIMVLLEKIFGPPVPPLDFLKKIFKPEFIAAIDHHQFYKNPCYQPGTTYSGTDQEILDLNQHSRVSVQNFIPGLFVKVFPKFPKKSALLETAVRSDSHEKGPEFTKDITLCLATLAPGGVLLIDGLRESYTRIYRFAEITAAMEKQPDFSHEFKAEVVLNAQHEPIAIMIQRAHPAGFLTPEDKAACFTVEKKIYFDNIDNVEKRPDLIVLNELRRKIIEIAKDEVRIFEDLHDLVNTELDKLLIQAAIPILQNFYKVDNQSDLKAVMAIETDEDLKRSILKTIKGRNGQNNDARPKNHKPTKGAPHSQLLEPRILDHKSLKEVAHRLALKLHETVKKSPYASQLFHPSISKTFNILQPQSIYGFPRLDTDKSPVNQEVSLPLKDLPDNNGFLRLNYLPEKITQLKQNLGRLLKRLHGLKPILIIDFADCSTNDLLTKKIKIILGEKDYYEFVEELKIAFRPGQRIVNLDHVKRVIEDSSKHGRIVTGGGSWYDAYDAYGKEYKKLIQPLIYDLDKNDSRLRLINICFSYQAMADLIGDMYCQKKISTHPGLLEIGPTPIHILHQGLNHELFDGFPRDFTMAMTHSGHVYDQRVGHDFTDTVNFLEPLATSSLTNLHVIWQGFGGKLIAMQGHPELDIIENGKLSPDVKKIMAELEKYELLLKKNFAVDNRLIQHNWDQAVQLNDQGKPNLKANAGPFILVNALHMMSESLK